MAEETKQGNREDVMQTWRELAWQLEELGKSPVAVIRRNLETEENRQSLRLLSIVAGRLGTLPAVDWSVRLSRTAALRRRHHRGDEASPEQGSRYVDPTNL
jgi:hypothetical protein